MKSRFHSLALALGLAFLVAWPAANADLILRQSTSAIVKIGPYISSTDGNTAQTGLTVANTAVQLSKNGATMASKNSGGCTHDALGYYTCTLDATDTNTVGRLQLMSHVATALPVYAEFNVLEEATYDITYPASATGLVPANVTQFGGSAGTFASGLPAVNSTQINSSAPAAAGLALGFNGTAGPVSPLGIARQGTAQAATGTTVQLDAAATFADDTPIGMTLVACGATTGYCQSRTVTDYVASTDTATVDAWGVTPTGAVTYYLFGTAPGSGGGGGGLDAAGVRAAVGLASANLDTQLAGVQSDTNDIQTRIPSALVSGRMDASVGAMAANTLTATAIATDAISAAKLATDAGTEIATANWANGTRTLTAGTNIALAKGTGITGFNDIAATDVWAATTRTLSAGTNIVLAKGTGITGLNDLDASGVRTAVGLGSANLDTQLTAQNAATVADAVWDEARTGHVTAGTFGNYLDASISGVSTGGVSAGAIADAVWDEVMSGHVTSGTAGAQLTAASAGGGGGGLDAAGVRAAIGLATANLDTQLSGLSAGIAGVESGITWNSAWDAEVQSEVTDALNALTLVEPSSKPSWGSSSVWQWLAWQAAWTRNAIQQNASQKILRNDANNANIATCAVSDDGTTLTVAECTP